MERVRGFVAIELTDQIKEELGKTQAWLKTEGIADQVRWVKPEGIHLTLKFLGDVEVGRVNAIVVAITRACEGIRPFSVGFGDLGCFPSVSRPNVVWIGVQGDTKELGHLQSRLEDRLAILGFPREQRRYTPHLTLGRVSRRVQRRERGRLGTLIQTQNIETLGEMKVHEVSLMKSVLSPTGAKYSQLAGVKLEG